MTMSSNWGDVIFAMAKQVWGNPTLERGNEVRWGKKFSKSVRLQEGTFFDFEEGTNGGVMDFIEHYFPNEQKRDVLERFGFKGDADFKLGLRVGVL
jgi:hypothetical protein